MMNLNSIGVYLIYVCPIYIYHILTKTLWCIILNHLTKLYILLTHHWFNLDLINIELIHVSQQKITFLFLVSLICITLYLRSKLSLMPTFCYLSYPLDKPANEKFQNKIIVQQTNKYFKLVFLLIAEFNISLRIYCAVWIWRLNYTKMVLNPLM